MRQNVVVLDPGHGGDMAVGGSSSTRALGPNGLREKDLTLDLARRVRSLLSPPVHVVLTRDDDRNMSLSRRANVARENDAAVFLSLHFDGSRDSLADRTQAWIARDAPAATRRFAESVTTAVARVAGIAATPPAQRNLGVLLPERHGANTHACLIEIAYLTNTSQASRLERDSYRQDLASAIATAVKVHLGESPAGALQSPAVIDEALDNKQAMIYSPKAPREDVDQSRDIRADERAIWTYCPKGFNINEPEVLVFFHGHRQFVAATLVDGAIKPRKPTWAPKALTKPNAGVNYGFDKTDGLLHQPIEMLPEVGVGVTGDPNTWCVEPAGKMVNKSALGEMIDNCLDRLSRLDKPSGRVKYLSKKVQTKDLKRLFLMGHSGGSNPLSASASSNVARSLVTDLVAFDATFAENITPYFDFCKHWNDKGLLGNGERSSRFITVYGSGTPNMGPTGGRKGSTGDTLLHRLTKPEKAGGLGLTSDPDPILVGPEAKKSGTTPAIVWPTTEVIYINHKTDSKDRDQPPSSANLDGIRQALKKNYKAVFIFTNVGHEGIPLVFTPLILEYTRNP
jgi:N-acetylmuramoyl-L-alanine amidase